MNVHAIANSAELTALIERATALLERVEQCTPVTQRRQQGDARLWRWNHREGFVAIRRPRLVEPTDLLWIDEQAGVLAENTRQFLAGQPANHALLWGARGTGKSSLIRSLPKRFADQPLQLIEVAGAELARLPELIDGLDDDSSRNVLFADDLSFDAADPSYTALKALLDGSLSATPDNVLIYATSNRRHLMPESMADNLDTHIEAGELHPGEAVEEKISLSDRFGVWLSFHPFSQKQYLGCVAHWLQRLGAKSDGTDEFTQAAALRWALRRGARNGRVAWQFAVSQLG